MSAADWLLLFLFTAAWEAFWDGSRAIDQADLKAVGRHLDPTNPFMR